jgi:O-antigen ligase
LPILLTTGPFLPDLIVVIFTLYFCFLFFKKKIFLNAFLKRIIFFFLCLCFVFFLSSLASNFIFSSLKYSFTYIRFILFSICIYFLLNKENSNFYKFFKYFFYLYSFVIIDALIQFIFTKDLFFIPKPSNDRVTGLFGAELILGSYLSRLFPFYLISMIILKDKIIYHKHIYIFLLVLNIFVVGISGERTSLFYIFLILTFGMLSKIYLKQILIFVFFISIILIFLVNYLNIFVNQRFQQSFNQIIETLDGKYLISNFHQAHFESAVKMFLDNPILGVGPRNFRFECSDIKYFTEYSCSTHPHNTYLQLLSETGIFPAFAVLLIFLFCCFKIFKFIVNKKLELKLQVEFLLYISLFITLFPFSPSGSFFNNWLNIIYYLPIPFLIYLNKNTKNFNNFFSNK